MTTFSAVVTTGIYCRPGCGAKPLAENVDRKSTRLNSSHSQISYAVFCLKKKKTRYDRVAPGILGGGGSSSGSGGMRGRRHVLRSCVHWRGVRLRAGGRCSELCTAEGVRA